MDRKLLTIGDIYAGKPDANDEIKEQGYDEFVNSYIKPSGINVDELAITKYGSPYFVMGDKGTGKTALLHFLEDYVRTIDESACSSFVFFESGYSQVDRAKLNTISQAISTPITVDSTIASSGKELECDFTYIWRWQFYQKIIDDNSSFNDNLFQPDEYWTKFCFEISKISKTIYGGKMRIPAKITFSAVPNTQLGTVEPSIGIEPLDLSKPHFSNTASYGDFIKIIEKADDLILNVTRTDIPYYIFIDELEAYRSDSDVFYRDLRKIRDLLFTTKRMNDTFREHTKFICSVRLEILNSINRFVQSNQLHKIMQAYDKRLTWEYANTYSFKHPIVSILIRRIDLAEEKAGIVRTTYDELNERVHKLFSHTFLVKKLIIVLNDLYRIGFIGNYLNNKTATQWEYKEKYSLLIDAPWKMIIHCTYFSYLQTLLMAETRVNAGFSHAPYNGSPPISQAHAKNFSVGLTYGFIVIA